MVLGEDILDPYGGAFKVTQGLSSRFPDRVFTTPISEAAIVGVSVGLALRGLHPIAEIMFGDFLALAADQIVNHAAKYPAMYNGQVQAPLVIRAPMGGGRGYGPTHSQSLERLFFGIPHLKLVAPSHAHDPGALLSRRRRRPGAGDLCGKQAALPAAAHSASAIDHGPRSTQHVPRPRLTHHEQADAFGYPVVTLTNYASGAAPRRDDYRLWRHEPAARARAGTAAGRRDSSAGLFAQLHQPAGLEPLVAAAAQSGRVLIVEESQAAFGWGAEVAAMFVCTAWRSAASPIARLGAAPTVIPAGKALEDQVLVTEAGLVGAILRLLAL